MFVQILFERLGQRLAHFAFFVARPIFCAVVGVHILPNSLTSVLVESALAIPRIILAEAGLSYLGLGVPPSIPSWGKMIAEGQNVLETAPWISLIPGFMILLATLGFNLVGDGLRDFFDPTQLR